MKVDLLSATISRQAYTIGQYYIVYANYRIEGNFYMVQTYAVFADDPTMQKPLKVLTA